MSLTRTDLLAAIERIAAAMERDFALLNAADGALGDGDLGVTMTRGMSAIMEARDGLPADLGVALLHCAQAFTRTSGSSYGTLLATGLMAAARALKGRETVDEAEISGLVTTAREAMQARGKAEPGGKTVLDTLDAVAAATAGKSDRAGLADAAAGAADAALDAFRQKPATVGRARIFGEKSVGLDDPGMLAMNRIVKAAAGRES